MHLKERVICPCAPYPFSETFNFTSREVLCNILFYSGQLWLCRRDNSYTLASVGDSPAMCSSMHQLQPRQYNLFFESGAVVWISKLCMSKEGSLQSLFVLLGWSPAGPKADWFVTNSLPAQVPSSSPSWWWCLLWHDVERNSIPLCKLVEPGNWPFMAARHGGDVSNQRLACSQHPHVRKLRFKSELNFSKSIKPG